MKTIIILLFLLLPSLALAQQTQTSIQNAINSNITTNGQNQITGAKLNSVLTTMNGAIFQAPPTVNVMSFGADPTGTNPSQQAFTSAIAALPYGGEVTYCGTFKFTATLVIPGNITMQGCNRNAAIILGVGTSLVLFQVGTGSNNPADVQINDTAFAYTTTQTSPAASIWVRNGHNIKIDRIISGVIAAYPTSYPYASIIFDGGAGQYGYSLKNFEIGGGTYGIINGLNSLVTEVTISNGVINGTAAAGISDRNIGGHYGTDVDITNAGTYGMEIIPGNGQSVSAIRVNNYLLDTPLINALQVCPTGTGLVSVASFSNIWAASATGNGSVSNTSGNGINICSTGVISGLAFNGGTIINNMANGVYDAYAGNSPDITFNGVSVVSNSEAGSGLYSGYRFAANVGNFNIVGGIAGAVENATNNQLFGVEVAAGTAGNYSVVGVNLCSNVSNAQSDGGTGLDRLWWNNVCGSLNSAYASGNGSQFLDGIKIPQAPTSAWPIDVSGQLGITVAHSSCTTLTNVTGSGLIVLQAENGGTIGVFAYGGGTVSLISAGATSTAWIVGSSPTADQIGLNFTGTVLQVCAGSDTTWDTYPNVKAAMIRVGSGF